MVRALPENTRENASAFYKQVFSDIIDAAPSDTLILKDKPDHDILMLLRPNTQPVFLLLWDGMLSFEESITDGVANAVSHYKVMIDQTFGISDSRFYLVAEDIGDAPAVATSIEKDFIEECLFVPDLAYVVEALKGAEAPEVDPDRINMILQIAFPGASPYAEEAKPEPNALPIRPNAKFTNFASPKRIGFLERVITKAVTNLIGSNKIYSAGVAIDPAFVASRDTILPALLISASEAWAPVVAKSKGKGGFDVRLKHDKDSLIGLRVADVLCSSPLMLVTPAVAALKKCRRPDGDYDMDILMKNYLEWMEKHEVQPVDLRDVEFRVARSSAMSAVPEEDSA